MKNHGHEFREVIAKLTEALLPGKEKPLKLALTALLSGGHILIEDIPGLGKTTLALALAKALGLSFGRVQCTSDLLPSDITGLTIFDRHDNSFRFVKGPAFNNILLVDEINRAMPKTQSALLEAMEEQRVTADGITYDLPKPFLVIATQNPAEQVGTYPLPESQMDRFLIRTGMGYPDEEVEKEIICHGSIHGDLQKIEPMIESAAINSAIAAISDIYLSEKLAGYIYQIVAATRCQQGIVTGISTRGAIGIARAARVSAFMDSRGHVLPEDIKTVATAVGAHRLLLKSGAAAVDKESLLNGLLSSIPIPLS